MSNHQPGSGHQVPLDDGAFTQAEVGYLVSGPRLARVATVGVDGAPHVVPTGWAYNPDDGTIELRGVNLAATKKYRDIARTGRAAIVVDDVLPPWRPRAIEVRGRAEALGGPSPMIRIHADHVQSWGLDAAPAERDRPA